MLVDWVDGLGDTDFWAYEFPCGLQVAIEFRHMRESDGLVCADSPEANHVVRHLPFSKEQCIPMNEIPLREQLDLLLSYYPERQDEINALRSFQVWRQGDDGNAFKVGEPTSERDCRCWVSQLESSHHKQTYWYSPVCVGTKL